VNRTRPRRDLRIAFIWWRSAAEPQPKVVTLHDGFRHDVLAERHGEGRHGAFFEAAYEPPPGKHIRI
jgi:hypothetical protein